MLHTTRERKRTQNIQKDNNNNNNIIICHTSYFNHKIAK